jgi:uncharacterized membrane protein
MRSLMTLLGGASLGAGGMYLMDPDRGRRRRAELRDALAEVDTSELVERARRLEPTVRQLGGSVGAMLEPARAMLEPARAMLEPARAMLEPARLMSGSALPRWNTLSRSLGWRRRRSVIHARDWAVLGGLVGAIATSLWLARRWSAAGEGIEVVREMTVDAPVERVYEFWNEFENFPRFMSHVHEVRRTGADRTHWVVAGPGGTPVEWDAVVTRRVPNEEIGWRTVHGSLVEHSGSVRFRSAGVGQTRIDVRMTYRPMGGALGHGLATLLGSDPERVIADDLDRLATQLRGPRAATGESGPRR